MFDTKLAMLNVLADQGFVFDAPEYQLRQVANKRFRSAYAWGRVGQIWAFLTRQDRRLKDIAEEEKTNGKAVGNGHHAGIRSVPISQIKGSLSRVGDFDINFQPIRPHVKDRWINIAVARQRGIPLPPVDLVKVGDDYYVRDGHHRISVARSLGEKSIEAQVVNRSQAITNI